MPGWVVRRVGFKREPSDEAEESPDGDSNPGGVDGDNDNEPMPLLDERFACWIGWKQDV